MGVLSSHRIRPSKTAAIHPLPRPQRGGHMSHRIRPSKTAAIPRRVLNRLAMLCLTGSDRRRPPRCHTRRTKRHYSGLTGSDRRRPPRFQHPGSRPNPFFVSPDQTVEDRRDRAFALAVIILMFKSHRIRPSKTAAISTRFRNIYGQFVSHRIRPSKTAAIAKGIDGEHRVMSHRIRPSKTAAM